MAGVSDDLLAAARAREASLYAVAWLTTGDPALAHQETVSALGGLLRSRPGDDVQPRRLTRELFAARVVEAPREPREPVKGSLGLWGLGSEDEELAATSRGLADLPPRDRLALALVELDDCSVGDAVQLSGSDIDRRSAHDVVESALARVDDELEALTWAPTAAEAIRRLADTAYLDRSPATDALALVLARRRRTRWFTAAGVAAVLAVVLGIAAVQRESSIQVAPSPSPSVSGPLAKGIMVDGVRLMEGATPSEARGLPRLPDPERLGLPVALTPPEGDLPALEPDTASGSPILAVFVERITEGIGRVLLYLPGASVPWVTVPDLGLHPRQPGVETVGPRTISDDGHRAVFVEGSDVVVVDVRDASIKRFSVVPTERASVGWLGGSDEVIVESDIGNRRLDVATSAVQPAATPASPDRTRLTTDGSLNQLKVFDERGVLAFQHEQSRVVAGFGTPTATSAEGLSAAGAILAPNPMNPRVGSAVFAVGDRLTDAVALSVPGIDNPYAVCCQVVGWAPEGRVLFVGGTTEVPLLLAWDVHTGDQFLVSDLSAMSQAWDDGWIGEFALAARG